MRRVLFVAAAVAVVALNATAGVTRRRAVRALPVKDELSITFTRPLVDLGTINHKTREEIGVRIDGTTTLSGRAVLRASLANPDARYTVRIDGITIGAMPVVVDPRASIGVTTIHRIEIEVPASAPEGSLMTSINWEAVTP
jgi:hypothetical protein